MCFSEQRFGRMRAVIDEKAIELDTMRKRLSEAALAAQKTVDKDLAKNIVLKYLALPGTRHILSYTFLVAVFLTSQAPGWEEEKVRDLKVFQETCYNLYLTQNLTSLIYEYLSLRDTEDTCEVI